MNRSQTGQEGRHAENQQHVRGVRADDVSESYAGSAFQNRLDRDQHFRHGGAEGDDGQRHDQRGHTDAQSQIHRAPDQRVPGEKQGRQTKPGGDQIRCDHACPQTQGPRPIRYRPQFGHLRARRNLQGETNEPSMPSTANATRKNATA